MVWSCFDIDIFVIVLEVVYLIYFYVDLLFQIVFMN